MRVGHLPDRPAIHTLLRHDRTDCPNNSTKSEDQVDFTLTYEGPLAADARPNQKHDIRRELHPQLKELWEHPPLNQLYWKARPGSQHLRTVRGHEFVSIVHPDWHFNAELNILMLRPELPGRIVTSGGDIDNRLKTLFDAVVLQQ